MLHARSLFFRSSSVVFVARGIKPLNASRFSLTTNVRRFSTKPEKNLRLVEFETIKEEIEQARSLTTEERFRLKEAYVHFQEGIKLQENAAGFEDMGTGFMYVLLYDIN